jgi:DNA-binding winged helix-turn-helix (wHTH) protein
MPTIAITGFKSPDALRFLDALRTRDKTLRLTECVPGQMAVAGRAGASAALVWASGLEAASPSAVAAESADARLPIVLMLPRFDDHGIDLSRGAVELCLPPFTVDEALLRLVLVRKRANQSLSANVLSHGELLIDLDRYEVTLAGRKADLTYKEYELLKFLASNPGRVFSRESLLRSVWEYDYFGGTRTVDVHVRRLRSKIDDVRHGFIETVWNVGYRFCAPGPAKPASDEQ